MFTVRKNLGAIILIATVFANSVVYADNFGVDKRPNEASKKRETVTDVKGEIFYTTANMWHENPSNFCSVNFHRGNIIPAGTKVKIIKCNRSRIKFYDKDTEMTYTYIHSRKHSRIKLQELFNRYFSEEDVMAEGGKFSKFTKEEQVNVEEGIIAVGMSKEAVLMAYGYPPTHQTRSLKNNTWTYWESRAGRVVVYFKDNVVTDIEGQ